MSVQVVVVTGAASGIGAAIAIAFAKLNASICVTDINAEDLHKISTDCQKLSKNRVVEVVADLRRDEDLENIVKCVLKNFGKVDVLVNCAGIFKFTNLQDSDIIEKFDLIFSVNLRSVVALTRKFLPALIESKGCVINLSSIGSFLVVESALIYNMTKAGVVAFTKNVARELASLGVRVNCISPGPVMTNVLKNTGLSENEYEEILNVYKNMTPMKKFVKSEEIAGMAVYLASDMAASITGSDFVVDAGIVLGSGTASPDQNKVNKD